MESAGYALQIFDIGIQNAMGTNIIIRSMADILVRRGVLAIGGHVVWAALYGGALALIKGKGKMSPKCFANSLFWLTFSAAFLLHTAWNFSASYLAGKLPDSLVASLVKFEAGTVTQWVKYIVLIILAWLLLFYIMKKSIRQMVSVDEMYHNAANSAEAVIQGVSGLLNGKTYMLTAGTPLIFGRRTEKCNVLFKNETKGISSIHCKIKWYNGKVLIKDLGSTYGTWLNEGTRLEPNKYYELPDQGVFYLGSKENMFFMGMK